MPPTRHQGLLRPRADLRRAGTTIDAWFRAAADRGHKMCTLAAAAPTRDVGVTPLAPVDLHPSAAPADLVHRALGEGFAGLAILIWADQVIADTSSEFHDGIETALTELCVEHPVSVLCVYDRPGAGADHLDLAVRHHPGGLHEQQLTLDAAGDTVRLSGEIDVTNVDVVAATLAAAGRPQRLRIDLGGTTFLSAAAAHLIHQHAAALRAGGADVELHGVAPHIARVLRVIERHVRSRG